MKRRDFCKASVIVGTAAALPAKELLAVAYGSIAEIVSAALGGRPARHKPQIQ